MPQPRNDGSRRCALTDRERPGLDASAIADTAAANADATDAGHLAGFVEMLLAVSATGRRLTPGEVDSRRALGAAGAERNVALRCLIDLYLNATWLTWRELPAIRGASGEQVRDIAECVLRAADDAIVALADGYDEAQRAVLREEEARRREFVDDLLAGRSGLGRLAEMAERFGLRIAGQLIVAAVQSDRDFVDGDAVTRSIESAMLEQFGPRDVLVTTKDGMLICVASAAVHEPLAALAGHVETTLADSGHWRMGVGRPHPGPGGVVRSYEEARGTIELAAALGLPARVVDTADLLVFQVLLRDRAAIIDLVDTVLGPLVRTRGGAEPLLQTLEAYFSVGGVTAAAARRLYLSVRAVTYRLDRIRSLTGKDVNDPTDRFTLQAAVMGARLLGWPAVALPRTE
ncbi:helix-turn-helix domain-containing protein [Mycobacterium sp. B14F4]|uniref:PucR family transcriptional regulator n=1 Tax=Mycobacterium sp. B14F4 TaxID=3153565 RepID=UPI00325E273B